MKTTRYAGFVIRERSGKNGSTSFQVDLGIVDGKHRRKQFRTFADAKNYAELKQVEKRNYGMQSLKLTDELRLDALAAANELKGTGVSLLDAAREYRRLYLPADDAISIDLLVDQFLTWMEKTPHKLRRGKKAYPGPYRDATKRDARLRLNAFADDMGSRAAVTITADDITGWLDSKDFSPTRWEDNLRSISMMYTWAGRTGNPLAGCANPAKGIQILAKQKSNPAIFTPKQTHKVFSWLEENRPECIPFFAVTFFAGVRPDEALRLEWDAVDFEENYITISAEQSKTHQERFIPMSDNLCNWLAMYNGEGSLAPSESTVKRTRQQMRKDLRIKWPSDVARHSFATYYAGLNGLDETAEALGHKGTATLLEHYKAIIKRKKPQAEKYFNIMPEGAAEKVIELMQA
jgi:integrase